jgi:hypothetical protein
MIEGHAASLRETQLREYISDEGIVDIAWLNLRALHGSFHNLCLLAQSRISTSLVLTGIKISSGCASL